MLVLVLVRSASASAGVQAKMCGLCCRVRAAVRALTMRAWGRHAAGSSAYQAESTAKEIEEQQQLIVTQGESMAAAAEEAVVQQALVEQRDAEITTAKEEAAALETKAAQQGDTIGMLTQQTALYEEKTAALLADGEQKDAEIAEMRDAADKVAALEMLVVAKEAELLALSSSLEERNALLNTAKVQMMAFDSQVL